MVAKARLLKGSRHQTYVMWQLRTGHRYPTFFLPIVMKPAIIHLEQAQQEDQASTTGTVSALSTLRRLSHATNILV